MCMVLKRVSVVLSVVMLRRVGFFVLLSVYLLYTPLPDYLKDAPISLKFFLSLHSKLQFLVSRLTRCTLVPNWVHLFSNLAQSRFRQAHFFETATSK